MDTSLIVLSHLLYNEPYARKVLPFVKSEYFQTKHYRLTFDLMTSFVGKYNTFPTKEALLVELQNTTGINENVFRDTKELIIDIKSEEETNEQWLVDKTEDWCKSQALDNALSKAIEIRGGKSDLDRGAITQIFEEALSVTFDSRVGHDYLEDAEARYDFYNQKEKRIPWSLKTLNTITDGGAPTKSLICFIAPTGGGKSRLMANEAAFQLEQGFNVLYVTMEMAAERIGMRIDANLLDIPIKELRGYPRSMYKEKVGRVRTKTAGKLIIREYPTASAGVNHFRYLLQELKLKKKFIPDIIYIDYINICLSSRLKMGGTVNSYTYVKAIAEELRGLGVEHDCPIVTATQVNREGFKNSDIEMENTSESMGLPHTCDLLVAMMPGKDENLDHIYFKQLKNRDGDVSYMNKFVVGLDRPKMRLYDLENPVEGVVVTEDKPLMDNTEFGKRDNESDPFKDFY